MPKTKLQGIIFGLLMSYTMAYGMEVYNIANNAGVQLTQDGFRNLSNAIFLDALIETLYMGVIVFLCSSLWGNRIGQRFMMRHCSPDHDHPYFCQLMRQAGTIAMMCPTMSLFASVLFHIILAKASIIQLPTIWISTILKNFPMAFFWNMFAAAPCTHWLFHLMFDKNKNTNDVSHFISL